MKKYISILFLVVFVQNAIAQNTILKDELWQDYTKCLDLVENNKHEYALPSLCNLLNHLEEIEPFNVDAYLAVLFLLDDCYHSCPEKKSPTVFYYLIFNKLQD